MSGDLLTQILEAAREMYRPTEMFCHCRVLGIYTGSSPKQKHVRLVMRRRLSMRRRLRSIGYFLADLGRR